jgi:exodeoxyribonuclease V beta subunit
MPGHTQGLQELKLLESPLSGTNLIEAGAGTGKTYTITCLFLRLILEKRFPVKDILVVTYTVAATEELRDRIRRKIREALDAYSRGNSDDPFVKGLVQKTGDAKDAISLLRAALHDFDEASIFTIHGFCQRTLHESAFESGSLFDTELEPEQTAGILEEIARDFWRRHFYTAPAEFVSYARSKKFGPDFFLDLINKGRAHLDVTIIPEVSGATEIDVTPFRAVYEKLQAAWLTGRKEVEAQLKHPGLYADYTKHLPAYLEMMDAYVDGALPPVPLPAKFEKFTAAELGKKTKRGNTPPRHPFYDFCEELQGAETVLKATMDHHLLYLKGEIFRCVQRELPARKQRRNIQFFDDLLTRLRRSLNESGGTALAEALRRRYKAALIDEFQDTDPVQYAIFRTVFGKDESILFLIGDPKQAIYSFRGADLFAYMKAAGQVNSRYTLTSNWRSEPGLIQAVNTIFANGTNPFLYRDIPFEPAVPGKGEDHAILTIDDAAEPPFHLWFVDAEETDTNGFIKKGVVNNRIAEAVAGEIARLIHLGRSGKARIGDNALREADIAVLTRSNREAQLMQKALSRLRIPSVLYSTGNLFDTDEAAEMNRVLEGIINPGREGLIRGALATDMMGMSGEAVERLQHDEAGWETVLNRFHEYYDMWNRFGFIRMFRSFLLREKVRSRLLSLPSGERRLTNVLHLSELLHQTATEEKLGMAGLLKWLACQRDPESPRLEEHQLRLESDANAVKIVTIHKSKGLEYPVVFCPFNWGGSRIKTNEVFAFHDEHDDAKLKLVIDPEGSADRALAEKEALAENLRLLYVSLTRAKNRCYLVWGKFKDA